MPAPLPDSPSLAAAAVSVRGLDHVHPNGTHALTGIDLTVAPGEFVTLIGPSGCGKSTLLRLIAGLDRPTAGTLERHAVERAAFVFQQPTLMPWARVATNVALPLTLAGTAPAEASAKVQDALRQVGLEEFKQAFPRELSGGMQMRASIARALVTEPDLLLMDEPFGALDEITRDRLDRELLALWQARRFTALFVTHSLHEAVYLSNRVVVMSPRPGRIAAELRIDEPYPRAQDFRVSERFVRWCKDLSGMMIDAGAA